LIRRGGAHERADVVSGHFEVAATAKTFEQLLTARFAAGAGSRFHQTDVASFDPNSTSFPA
jgi:hypothetical protein